MASSRISRTDALVIQPAKRPELKAAAGISRIPVLAITRAMRPGILARSMNSRAHARERVDVTASRKKVQWGISRIPVLAITRALMPDILARSMNSRAHARERGHVTASRMKALSQACAVLAMRMGHVQTPVAFLKNFVSLILVISLPGSIRAATILLNADSPTKHPFRISAQGPRQPRPASQARAPPRPLILRSRQPRPASQLSRARWGKLPRWGNLPRHPVWQPRPASQAR